MTIFNSLPFKYFLFLAVYTVAVTATQLSVSIVYYINDTQQEYDLEISSAVLQVRQGIRGPLQAGDLLDARRIISTIANSYEGYTIAILIEDEVAAISNPYLRTISTREELNNLTQHLASSMFSLIGISESDLFRHYSGEICVTAADDYRYGISVRNDCYEIFVHADKSRIFHETIIRYTHERFSSLPYIIAFLAIIWYVFARKLSKRIDRILGKINITKEKAELELNTGDELEFIEKSFEKYDALVKEESKSKNELLKQLEEAAYIDPLTELLNRRSLEKKRKDISEQSGVNLVMIDLDYFKSVNDDFGHDVGDRFLTDFSKYLVNLGLCELVFRLGGEEFLAIFYSEDEQSGVTNVNDLHDALMEFTYVEDGIKINRTVSIGHYFKQPTSDLSSAMKFADVALAHSKKNGRARFTTANKEFLEIYVAMTPPSLNDLRKAIESGEMSYFFQPIIDATKNKLVGVEALVRWVKSDGEVLQPGEFLDQFIAVTKDRRYLLVMYEQLGRELINLKLSPEVYVSLNFNISDLASPGFADVLSKDLALISDVPERVFVVEISESELSSRHDRVKILEEINKLNKYGIKVALDDFGVSGSNVERLVDFQVDIVKIDKKFTRDIVELESRQLIMKHLVDLISSLNLSVIVEGVETPLQRERLIQVGAIHHQGYYYMRPVPANIFAKVSFTSH